MGLSIGSIVGGLANPVAAIGTIGAVGSDLYEGHQNRKAQEEANQQNIAMQKEFAQQGIQWKVEDARRAGINPLTALGAQTHTPSMAIQPLPSKGIGKAGQNISRALMSAQSPQQKKLMDLQIESAQLDVDEKRHGLTMRKSAKRINNQFGSSVGVPTQGQYDDADIIKKSSEVIKNMAGNKQMQAGQPPMFQLHNKGKNKYSLLLSEATKQAVEDSPQETMLQFDILLNGGDYLPKPPQGKRWEYNRWNSTASLVNKNKPLGWWDKQKKWLKGQYKKITSQRKK